jgi:hypothetical protein
MKHYFTLALTLTAWLSSTSFSTYAQQPLVELDSRFDISEVEWIKIPGKSTISGEAFLTLPNGETKGCAGFNVELLPAAQYANERIYKTYHNNVAGQVLLQDNPPKFSPDAPEYHDMVIKGRCNQNHQFLFEGLNAGEYYVIAFIIWDDKSPEDTEIKNGGAVMKKVTLLANDKQAVLLKK